MRTVAAGTQAARQQSEPVHPLKRVLGYPSGGTLPVPVAQAQVSPAQLSHFAPKQLAAASIALPLLAWGQHAAAHTQSTLSSSHRANSEHTLSRCTRHTCSYTSS